MNKYQYSKQDYNKSGWTQTCFELKMSQLVELSLNIPHEAHNV